VSESITTSELLDAAEERTGLLRGTLVLMAAKSATIRHLARDAERGPRFVLKGGTLLAHVYQGSRQSVRDADYLYSEPEFLTVDTLAKVFTIDEGKFQVHGDTAYWSDKGGYYEGAPKFSIDEIAMTPTGLLRNKLKVTVSVRPGEQLDPHDDALMYSDPLLAKDSEFEVNGLTRNELSAEKILAWCSKQVMAKHLVDLAGIGRDHAGHVDRTRVADLVRWKFDAEKDEHRYQHQKITTTGQLVERFFAEDRLTQLRLIWDGEEPAAELLLPKAELELDRDVRLSEAANVIRLAREFWEPMLDCLRD
jgi:hypothetical protein